MCRGWISRILPTISSKNLDIIEKQVRSLVAVNSYADLFSSAAFQSLSSEDMDSAHHARFFQALAKSICHSVGLSVPIAAELTQIRKEAVITTSKILTEESKDSLKKIPLLSQLLFGGKVREIYKNSEQQQNSFIAQSAVSVKSKTQSSDFKIPKGAPPKSPKLQKGPLILLNHLQEEVLEVVIHAQASEEGDGDPLPLEEPPEVNTDVSLPLPLPQSALPVWARLGHFVGSWEKIQKINGSFLSSKEATESRSFQISSFPSSDILPSVKHLGSGRTGPIATRMFRGSKWKLG